VPVDAITHETEIAAARWRVRAVAAAGVSLLACTAALLVFPTAVVVLWVFGLLGGAFGTGAGMVAWSAGVSLALGVVFGLGVFGWSLARAERQVLVGVRAWPLPGATGGRPVLLGHDEPERAQRLVDTIAIAAGVLPPRVAVVVDDAPNCLTVGRTPATAWIVVTTGLLRFPHRELEAVVAYELGRVAELDVSLDTVVFACTARGIELWAAAFGDFDDTTLLTAPVAVLVTPLVVGSLLLRGIALRHRARLSDGLAVRSCRDPAALLRALRRIQADPEQVRRGNPANAHLWLEYPHTRASRLFLRSHRVLPARIRRLERYGRLGA
jgi:Zn-dependent protease with chaperone function